MDSMGVEMESKLLEAVIALSKVSSAIISFDFFSENIKGRFRYKESAFFNVVLAMSSGFSGKFYWLLPSPIRYFPE